jgi:hypothetical protein
LRKIKKRVIELSFTSPEYYSWFFKYNPASDKEKKQKNPELKNKKKRKTRVKHDEGIIGNLF